MKKTAPGLRKHRNLTNEFSYLARKARQLEKELHQILDKWEGKLPDDAKARVAVIKAELAEVRPRVQELRVKLFF